MNEVIEHIWLEDIRPSAVNRKVGGFDQGKLEQLAESIKAVGVQQPAVVRVIPDPAQTEGGIRVVYELVAGERRWRASRLAGCETLPCIVRELTDAEALHIQIIENLQREDVHPLDEADGYARLIEGGQYDVEHVATELGKSASYIYQRLKLRDLIPAARELLVSGKITAGHAILMARLEPEQQKQTVKEGLHSWNGSETKSVRALDEWIHQCVLMELSKATWKMDDATLVPAAGSCSSCPKRTGFSPALFADVGKKDHCLDRSCFAGKAAAIVARRREELDGEAHLEVSASYGKLEAGTIHSHEWDECRKKDEGAMRVLIVDGAQAGRLTYGKKRSYGSGRSTPTTPEEIAAVKEEKARARKIIQAAEQVRQVIYEKVRAVYETDLYSPAGSAQNLAIQRIEIKVVWDRLMWDTQKAVARYFEWDIPKGYSGAMEKPAMERINVMDRRELDLFLFDMSFVPELKIVKGWTTRVPTRLRRAAGAIGLNVGDLLASVAAEFNVKVEEIDPPDRYAYMTPEYGVCKGCGCTDEAGCPEGCSWTDDSHTLCSVCAAKEIEDEIDESKINPDFDGNEDGGPGEIDAFLEDEEESDMEEAAQ